jgi:hypothetical protein
MRAILFQLPTVNFESLKCLVSLLVDVYQHTSINKMSLSNLVTCIVPSLDCSPAIITYSIQHFDFFFSGSLSRHCNIYIFRIDLIYVTEPQSTVQHSAPQFIRHSVSPSNLQAMLDATITTSPRHTIALPSPSSWFSPPPNFPSSQEEKTRRSQSPPNAQDAQTRRSHSPPRAARTSADSSGTPPAYSPSPLTVSLPGSPHHSPNLAGSGVSRNLSSSSSLLPPPPRGSSSPSRRNFLADRLSVAMTTSHSTPLSPRTSLSLQVSTSYPHNSSPTTHGPAPRWLANSYGPDWYALQRPAITRQPSEHVELRPRASSYVPQPTYLFGSDGEEIDDKASRRRSLTVLLLTCYLCSRSNDSSSVSHSPCS